MARDIMAYGYAIIALFAIPLIPLLVLGIFALRSVKNFGDPVRHGLIWFHCAVWFYFVSLLTMLIVMSVAISPAGVYSNMRGAMAMNTVEGIAVLLEMFGFFTLIMSITHLALGAHQVDTQRQSRKFLAPMRALVGGATILYSAYFIYQRWRIAQNFSNNNYYSYRAAQIPFAIIYLIVMVCLAIATLATTIYASVKYRKNRRQAYEAGVHHSTKGLWALIITASSISLVIALWKIVTSIIGGVSGGPLRGGWWVMQIINILLEYYLAIVILVLVYILGKKTTGGLYSGPVVPVTKDSHVEDGTGIVV